MTNIENSMELRKSGLRIAFVGIISVILGFHHLLQINYPGRTSSYVNTRAKDTRNRCSCNNLCLNGIHYLRNK